MNKPVHIRLSDIRGLGRLASDATVGLTDVVEAMHDTIGRTPGVFGTAPAGRTKGITGFVYRSVRGITRVVGPSLDSLLGVLAPLVAENQSSQEREALVAALNGVLGDYLVASGNPLAISMRVRAAGIPLPLQRRTLTEAFPQPGRKLVVLLHGLCMNDLQWNRDGHDHGAALARDLGHTPLYLHYNSGLAIGDNGRQLAHLMDTLLREWPHPIERLAIVGHSMGGLVARSAIHHGALAGHGWPRRLDDVVFLGTPHFGAPLERAGAHTDFLLGISPYTAPFARLGKIRSAGIQDLADGNLRDGEDQVPSRRSRAPQSLPLPTGVRCYAIAGSRQKKQSGRSGMRIRGDGLVPAASALGLHRDASFGLAFPEGHRWIGYGMGHFDLLCDGDVYERIRAWMASGDD